MKAEVVNGFSELALKNLAELIAAEMKEKK